MADTFKVELNFYYSLKCRYRRGHLYRQNSLIKRGGSLEKGCLRKLKRFRVALIRRNCYN